MSEVGEQPAAKRRRVNIMDEDIFVIVREVTVRKDIIHGKLETTLSKKNKNEAWDSITAAVNAVSPVVRNAADVCKKYVDFRSQVKKKVAAIKRDMQITGGGPSDQPPLTAAEEAMAAILEDIAIEGIPGMLDTEELAAAGGGGLQDDVDEEVVELTQNIHEHSYCAGPSTSKHSSTGRSSVHSILSSNVSSPAARPSSAELTYTPAVRAVTPAARSASTEPIFPHASRDTPPEPSVRRTAHQPRSRVSAEPLAPNMLRVQENIYEEVRRSADALSLIASILSDIRDKYLYGTNE
ncbi:hypothetical protein Pcinc_003477 [Petrolisthes cinctipes]|uniref:Regulatory protein zeste n=1 Tax=Petrolisthes cinctipes TaxID=88211 RepID=A0AAE1GIU6_PETCI|nr:hypothetical protein Pcinc_003477 [Petrolisthes cinctipes]